MKARSWDHATETPGSSARPTASASACSLSRSSTVISRSASWRATEIVLTSPISPPCSAIRVATRASCPDVWGMRSRYVQSMAMPRTLGADARTPPAAPRPTRSGGWRARRRPLRHHARVDAGTERSQARGAIPALELLVEALAGPGDADAEEHFYSHLAEAVCRLGDMRRAIIFRYDDPTRRVRVAGTHGVDPSAFNDAHISVELAPLAATALADDRVIEVLPGEEHFIAPEFAELAGQGALVYVPIATARRWPGVMLLEPAPRVPPLDSARRDLLWTLGKTLALASMARIATYQGQRARQLEDRLDLARDIHDGVIQRLFGVSLALTRPLDDEARARCG